MSLKDPSTHLSLRKGVCPGVSGIVSIFKHLKAALKRKEGVNNMEGWETSCIGFFVVSFLLFYQLYIALVLLIVLRAILSFLLVHLIH